MARGDGLGVKSKIHSPTDLIRYTCYSKHVNREIAASSFTVNGLYQFPDDNKTQKLFRGIN